MHLFLQTVSRYATRKHNVLYLWLPLVTGKVLQVKERQAVPPEPRSVQARTIMSKVCGLSLPDVVSPSEIRPAPPINRPSKKILMGDKFLVPRARSEADGIASYAFKIMTWCACQHDQQLFLLIP